MVWFEEPVPSEDRDGLRLLVERAPEGLDIAAGEYGFVLGDFGDLLDAGAVDCLQADVTRCGGITGLLQVAGLCSSRAKTWPDTRGACASRWRSAWRPSRVFCSVPVSPRSGWPGWAGLP